MRERRRRLYSPLPYVAIAATYILLVVALAVAGINRRAWIVVGGAAASTALVVGRQLAAFADNARLLAELDAKVTELNEAHAVLTDSLRQRDELATQLQHQAFHDNLTGLPNRALLMQRLHEATTGRTRYAQLVVMLLDLDDFKPVNDRLGHAAGDRLLTEVGGRLRACLRDTDTVARLGGDEFAVLIERLTPEDFGSVAARIVAAVQAPCDVGDVEACVRVSVGVVVTRPGERLPDEILRDADVAMYAAKERGKGRYEIFGRGDTADRSTARPGS
jgi:diguanylate cyclase (GGDEF)-like protein